jgi:hypothetical protein
MKPMDVAAATVLVRGDLNWGLVGTCRFDPVASVFGEARALSPMVYPLVGLAAVYQALQWKAIQRRWNSSLARA